MNIRNGLAAFAVIWGGQTASMIGSNMTRFALAIWIWDRTQEATAMVLVGVSATVPSLIASFFAGALVDRWNRKRIMMVSDLAAGVMTVILLLLFNTGQLELWHIYLASLVGGISGTFQSIAYSASISLLLPKEQYARAGGLNSLSQYASVIAAPLLAGYLMQYVGVVGIMFFDIVTFLIAVTALLFVVVPQPPRSETNPENRNAFWSDTLFGFRYIFQRPSLIGLTFIAFAFSMAEALGYPLIRPMILARTGGDEVILANIQAMLGFGGVVGAIVMSVWGGPRRRIHMVLIGLMLTGLLGDSLMGIGQSLAVWLFAAFCLEVFIPLTISSYIAIWQSKIPPEIQGRVFAARGLISTIAEPISMIIAGVLSDRILEPAMMPDGSLAPVFGGLVGTGPGAGMALILAGCGVLSAVAGLSGYLFYSVRHAEDILPDHDAVVVSAA